MASTTKNTHSAKPFEQESPKQTVKLFDRPFIDPNYHVLKIQPNDMVIGSSDSRVLMFAFTSPSCSHCETVHSTYFPKLKNTYIKQKDIAVVVRPLPNNRPALYAVKLLQYIKEPKVRQMMLDTLYESQIYWVLSNNYKDSINRIAAFLGVPDDFLNDLKQSDSWDKKIIENTFETQQNLNIDGIPYFIIGSQSYTGVPEYSTLTNIIDIELEKQNEQG